MFDWFKRKKKSKAKVKRDKTGRRVYKDEFNGEEITIKSMTKGTEDRLIGEYRILELQGAHDYYIDKVLKAEKDKEVSETELGNLEGYYFKAYAMLEKGAFKCGQEICRDSVQKPKEWFDDLSREEWTVLIVTVKMALDRNPIKQMHVYLVLDMIQFFRVNKGSSKFTGEEVAKLIEKRKLEYESGSVKKNNLNTVLKTVKPSPVTSAPTPQ